MKSRTIVVVSDALAYVNGHVVADFRLWRGGSATTAMDVLLDKYRAAGWRVLDHRTMPAHTAA